MPETPGDTKIQLNAKPSNELMVNVYSADVDELVLIFENLEKAADDGSTVAAAVLDVLRDQLDIKPKKSKKSKSKKDDDDDDDDDGEEEEEEDDEDKPSAKDLKVAKQLKIKGYKDMDADELKAAVRKAMKKGKKKSKKEDDD